MIPDGLISFIVAQPVSAIMQTSRWFQNDDMKVYVRAGTRRSYADNTQVLAYCISNVTVFREREGLFTLMMEQLELVARRFNYQEIQIENAASPSIKAWCEKHGFTEVSGADDSIFSRNFYRPIVSGETNA